MEPLTGVYSSCGCPTPTGSEQAGFPTAAWSYTVVQPSQFKKSVSSVDAHSLVPPVRIRSAGTLPEMMALLLRFYLGEWIGWC